MKILSGVVITLIALLVIFIISIYSGWYNISAMNEESGLMKWVFKTTKNNSIKSRLVNISVPDLKDSALIKEGFEHYNEMCVGCHGAPGLEETELSKGLNPRAPYLPKIAKYIEPAEMFWATKNGIRMTGMPAWGKTHSDEKIWAIVAFMKRLPDISAEEYEKLKNESGESETEHEHSDENKDHSHSSGDADHHH